MHEFDIWIDVMFLENGSPEIACTLFGAHKLPMRPLPGESLSYFQDNGSSYSFELRTDIGPRREHHIRVGIDDVSHYAVRTDEGLMYKTSVRCEAIQAQSLDDVRAICAFMTSQLGFELDPYAINRLQASPGEA